MTRGVARRARPPPPPAARARRGAASWSSPSRRRPRSSRSRRAPARASPTHAPRTRRTFPAPTASRRRGSSRRTACRARRRGGSPRRCRRGIEGFANENYADGRHHGRLLRVDPRAARSTSTRTGWAGTRGQARGWSGRRRTIARRVQPACPLTRGINMVSCANWTRSFTSCSRARSSRATTSSSSSALGQRAGLRPAHGLGPDEPRDVPDHEPDVHRGGVEHLRGLLLLPGRARAPSAPRRTRCATGRAWSPSTAPTTPGDGRVGLLRRRVPAHPVLRAARARRRLRHRRDRRRAPRRSCASHRVLLSLGHDESWSYQERVGLVDAERQGRQRHLLRRGRRCCGTSGSRPRRSGRTARRSTTATRARTRSTATASAMEVTGNTWSSRRPTGPPRPSSARSTAGTSSPGSSAPFVVADALVVGLRGHRAPRRLVAAPASSRRDIDHVDPVPRRRRT